jgi:GNAT superfamily N-acetyltransferase
MIRKATPEDISALVALQRSIEDEGAIWGYHADSAEEWAHRDLSWTLLAIEQDQIIGFVYCCRRPYSGECVFPQEAKILEIVDLIVATQNRRQGLGHEFLAALQRQARTDGFTHLRLYSSAKRFDDILRFYRSCGFTPWYLEMTKGIGAEPTNGGGAA